MISSSDKKSRHHTLPLFPIGSSGIEVNLKADAGHPVL